MQANICGGLWRNVRRTPTLDTAHLGPIVRVEDEGFCYFKNVEDLIESVDDATAQIGPLPLNELVLPSRIQRGRFDIDVPLRDQWVGASRDDVAELINIIIEKTIQVYHTVYYAEVPLNANEFIVMSSHGPTKISYHVMTPIWFVNAHQCKRFSNEVQLHLEFAGHKYLECIDWGIISGGSNNLRMPGAIKRRAPTRVKDFDEDFDNLGQHWSEALIGWYEDCDPPHFISEALHPPINSYSAGTTANRGRAIAAIELLKLHMSEFESTWKLSTETDRIIYFWRIKPSYCEICNRTHESDNTMFVTMSDNKKGTVSLCCRRKPDSPVVIGEVPPEVVRETIQDRVAALVARYTDEQTRPLSDHRKTLWRELNRQKFIEHNNVLIHNRPELIDFPADVRTLYVRAPMKMGKTAKILELIERTAPESVLYVSFRQTFSEAIVARLNAPMANGEAPTNLFVSYQNIAENTIYADMYPYLIVQVESLKRVDAHAYDLVVLDESESVLAQLSSPFVQHVSTTYALFESFLRTAKQVICMDANLGERTIKLVQAARPAALPNGILHFDKPVTQRLYYENTYKNAADYEMILVPSNKELYAQLVACLKDRKKCFLSTNSIEEATCFITAIKNEFTVNNLTSSEKLQPEGPDVLKVALYTSKTNVSMRSKHFKDVNEWWGQADLLIYTPTVTAGVSFDKTHFDVGFGLFTSKSCDVETCRQMMGRIRNIVDKKIYVHLDVAEMRLPTEHAIVGRLLLNVKIMNENRILFDDVTIPTISKVTPEGRIVIEPTNCFELTVANMIHANYSRNNFAKRFIEQMLDTGVKITYRRSVGRDEELTYNKASLREQAAETEAIAIAGATSVSFETYQTIMDAKKHGFIQDQSTHYDDETMAAVSKYHLTVHYKVEETRIDKTFVRLFNSVHTMRNFHNLAEMRPVIRWRGVQPTMPLAAYASSRPTKNLSRDLVLAMLRSFDMKQIGEYCQMDDSYFQEAIKKLEQTIGRDMRSGANVWAVVGTHFHTYGIKAPAGIIAEALRTFLGLGLSMSGKGKGKKYKIVYPEHVLDLVIEVIDIGPPILPPAN